MENAGAVTSDVEDSYRTANNDSIINKQSFNIRQPSTRSSEDSSMEFDSADEISMNQSMMNECSPIDDVIDKFDKICLGTPAKGTQLDLRRSKQVPSISSTSSDYMNSILNDIKANSLKENDENNLNATNIATVSSTGRVPLGVRFSNETKSTEIFRKSSNTSNATPKNLTDSSSYDEISFDTFNTSGSISSSGAIENSDTSTVCKDSSYLDESISIKENDVSMNTLNIAHITQNITDEGRIEPDTNTSFMVPHKEISTDHIVLKETVKNMGFTEISENLIDSTSLDTSSKIFDQFDGVNSTKINEVSSRINDIMDVQQETITNNEVIFEDISSENSEASFVVDNISNAINLSDINHKAAGIDQKVSESNETCEVTLMDKVPLFETNAAVLSTNVAVESTNMVSDSNKSLNTVDDLYSRNHTYEFPSDTNEVSYVLSENSFAVINNDFDNNGVSDTATEAEHEIIYIEPNSNKVNAVDDTKTFSGATTDVISQVFENASEINECFDTINEDIHPINVNSHTPELTNRIETIDAFNKVDNTIDEMPNCSDAVNKAHNVMMEDSEAVKENNETCINEKLIDVIDPISVDSCIPEPADIMKIVDAYKVDNRLDNKTEMSNVTIDVIDNVSETVCKDARDSSITSHIEESYNAVNMYDTLKIDDNIINQVATFPNTTKIISNGIETVGEDTREIGQCHSTESTDVTHSVIDAISTEFSTMTIDVPKGINNVSETINGDTREIIECHDRIDTFVYSDPITSSHIQELGNTINMHDTLKIVNNMNAEVTVFSNTNEIPNGIFNNVLETSSADAKEIEFNIISEATDSFHSIITDAIIIESSESANENCNEVDRTFNTVSEISDIVSTNDTKVPVEICEIPTIFKLTDVNSGTKKLLDSTVKMDNTISEASDVNSVTENTVEVCKGSSLVETSDPVDMTLNTISENHNIIIENGTEVPAEVCEIPTFSKSIDVNSGMMNLLDSTFTMDNTISEASEANSVTENTVEVCKGSSLVETSDPIDMTLNTISENHNIIIENGTEGSAEICEIPTISKSTDVNSGMMNLLDSTFTMDNTISEASEANSVTENTVEVCEASAFVETSDPIDMTLNTISEARNIVIENNNGIPVVIDAIPKVLNIVSQVIDERRIEINEPVFDTVNVAVTDTAEITAAVNNDRVDADVMEVTNSFDEISESVSKSINLNTLDEGNEAISKIPDAVDNVNNEIGVSVEFSECLDTVCEVDTTIEIPFVNSKITNTEVTCDTFDKNVSNKINDISEVHQVYDIGQSSSSNCGIYNPAEDIPIEAINTTIDSEVTSEVISSETGEISCTTGDINLETVDVSQKTSNVSQVIDVLQPVHDVAKSVDGTVQLIDDVPQSISGVPHSIDNVHKMTVDVPQENVDLPQMTVDVSQVNSDTSKKTNSVSQPTIDVPQVTIDVLQATSFVPQIAADMSSEKISDVSQVNCDIPQMICDTSHAITDITRTNEYISQAVKDVSQEAEDVTNAAENVPKATEDVSQANEDVPRTAEYMPQGADDVPRAAEDVALAVEDVPQVTTEVSSVEDVENILNSSKTLIEKINQVTSDLNTDTIVINAAEKQASLNTTKEIKLDEIIQEEKPKIAIHKIDFDKTMSDSLSDFIAAEDMSRANEDVLRAAEYMPQAADDVPRPAEDVTLAVEDVPHVTSEVSGVVLMGVEDVENILNSSKTLIEKINQVTSDLNTETIVINAAEKQASLNTTKEIKLDEIIQEEKPKIAINKIDFDKKMSDSLSEFIADTKPVGKDKIVETNEPISSNSFEIKILPVSSNVIEIENSCLNGVQESSQLKTCIDSFSILEKDIKNGEATIVDNKGVDNIDVKTVCGDSSKHLQIENNVINIPSEFISPAIQNEIKSSVPISSNKLLLNDTENLPSISESSQNHKIDLKDNIEVKSELYNALSPFRNQPDCHDEEKELTPTVSDDACIDGATLNISDQIAMSAAASTEIEAALLSLPRSNSPERTSKSVEKPLVEIIEKFIEDTNEGAQDEEQFISADLFKNPGDFDVFFKLSNKSSKNTDSSRRKSKLSLLRQFDPFFQRQSIASPPPPERISPSSSSDLDIFEESDCIKQFDDVTTVPEKMENSLQISIENSVENMNKIINIQEQQLYDDKPLINTKSPMKMHHYVKKEPISKEKDTPSKKVADSKRCKISITEPLEETNLIESHVTGLAVEESIEKSELLAEPVVPLKNVDSIEMITGLQLILKSKSVSNDTKRQMLYKVKQHLIDKFGEKTSEQSVEKSSSLKEKLAYVDQLKAELTKTQSNIDRLQKIIGEYEDIQSELAQSNEVLKMERDTVQSHLSNAQSAYSDVFAKFERSKKIIEDMQYNENVMEMAYQELCNAIETSESKYNTLKKHAIQEINNINKQYSEHKSNNEVEVFRLKTLTKRLEIQIQALESSLQQKTSEVKELEIICDQLTNKLCCKSLP